MQGDYRINKTTVKHSKMQLFIQGHSQVSAAFSIYNSIQCGSGTYIIALCFELSRKSVRDEKQDIPLQWPYEEERRERSMNHGASSV